MGKIAYVAPTAAVTGKVTWDGKMAAPGIKVEAYRDGQLMASTTTDLRGRFTLPHLREGDYLLSATGPHATEASSMVTISGSEDVRMDLILEDRMIMGEMEYIPETRPNSQELIEEEDGRTGTEPGSSESIEDAQGRFGMSEDLEAPIKVGEFELTVFPNPTSALVTVRMDKVGTGLLSVTLIDAQGQEVVTGAWAQFMEVEQTIDVSALAAGVYVIRVRCGDAQVERRFVKE